MPTLAPTICAACAELLVSPAITAPHEYLTCQGRHAQQHGPHDTMEYRCLECESVWALQYAHDILVNASLCSTLADSDATFSSVVIACCPGHFTAQSRHNPAGRCVVPYLGKKDTALNLIEKRLSSGTSYPHIM